MNNLKLFWNKKGTVGIIIFIFLILAFIFSMLQPMSYGAKSKLLVIQKAQFGSDPYALSRSNAYLCVILSEVVSTYSFYNEVMDGDFGVQRRFFEKNDEMDKTLKNWKNSVKAKSVGDTGVIEIAVVHSNKQQAEKIIQGVYQTLLHKHSLFHGLGENVQVKIIDPAIVTQRTPDMQFNFGLALMLGVFLSVFYVLQYPGKQHDLRISKQKGSAAEENQETEILNWHAKIVEKRLAP